MPRAKEAILVRHYRDSDLTAVKALHKRQGLDYVLPDIDSKTMIVRAVVEENGVITDAAFLRRTAEAYWIFDPEVSTRKDRLGKLLILQKELLLPAQRAGLEDIHAWLPPEVEHDRRAARTMIRLGWRKALWGCYGREVR